MSGPSHAQVRRILEIVDGMTASSIEIEVSGFRLRAERAGRVAAEPRPAAGEDRAPAPAEDAAELTAEDLEDVLALIEESGFDVVELETPGLTARMRRSPGGAGAAAESAEQPVAERAGSEPVEEVRAPEDGMVDITAPLVGTFYRARSPGAPPFVEVGSAISEETEVCIIEAMKLMNYIPAGVRGTVAAVLAENEQAVESGTPLFRVEPDGA